MGRQRVPTGRRLAVAALALAASCFALPRFPKWGLAALGGEADGAPAPATGSGLPAEYAEALSDALGQIDALTVEVERQGVVRAFGRRADALVRRAVQRSGATGADAEAMERLLDASLKVLFLRQLEVIRARATDRYEASVLARPNPLEAGEDASRFFKDSASALIRPGADWSFEAEHDDLLQELNQNYERDMELVKAQSSQFKGKEVTLEVIRKLQQQAATVQREADSRGAFPWDIKWQYMVERSPVGFRGQYTQGRSVVELLLMPSPDPRLKNNLLNRIGPLNLAVGFDLFL